MELCQLAPSAGAHAATWSKWFRQVLLVFGVPNLASRLKLVYSVMSLALLQHRQIPQKCTEYVHRSKIFMNGMVMQAFHQFTIRFEVSELILEACPCDPSGLFGRSKF